MITRLAKIAIRTIESMKRIPIQCSADVLAARQYTSQMAAAVLSLPVDRTSLVTAVSELARNILAHAGEGFITIVPVECDNRTGVMVIAEDNGPGIADIALAMKDGYSTTNTLGLGLPGAKRLTDQFHIESSREKGTKIEVIKWNR